MNALMGKGWRTPVEVPDLSDHLIHAWLLEIDEAFRPLVEGSLSKPELERAAAFRFAVHRDQFTVVRGALRFLLGKYLNLSPGSVEIRCAEKGKPYVHPSPERNIQFNVSHSGKYAVFGFRAGLALGIDIELHQAEVIDDGLLDQCLMSAEKTRYMQVPPEGRVQFFFDTWARKEAYMKLKGEGVSIPPKEFQLSSADTAVDTIRGEEVHFITLPKIEGYSQSLATSEKSAGIEFYRLGSNLLR